MGATGGDVTQAEGRRAEHEQVVHAIADMRRRAQGPDPRLRVARQVGADQARVVRVLTLAGDVHVDPLAVQARPVGEARAENSSSRDGSYTTPTRKPFASR